MKTDFNEKYENDSTASSVIANRYRKVIYDDEADVSLLSLEAAVVTQDPRLLFRLKQLTETLPLDHDPYFASTLADAMASCTPKSKDVEALAD